VASCASIVPPKNSDENGELVAPAEVNSSISSDTATDSVSDLMFEVLSGELAGKLGDLDASKEFYSRAAELTDDPDVVERAMRIAIFAKDWPLAIKNAHRWSEVLNDNLESQQVLGVLYLRNGDIDAAETHFSNVMTAAADSPSQGFSIISSTLARIEDVDSSLALMDRLVTKRFDNPYGHLSYANLAMQARKFKLAVDQSELAIGFKPDLTEARILRSRALAALGDDEAAFIEMKMLVAEEPKNFELRLSYARMLLQANRFEMASAELETLLDQRPDDPDLRYTLGLTYVQTESYEQANENFQYLVDHNHRLDEAYYYLGRIAEAQGDIDEAIQKFKQVAYGTVYYDSAVRLAGLYVEKEGMTFARNYLAEVRSDANHPEDIIRLYLSEGQLLHEKDLFEEAYDIYSEGLREFPRHPDLLYARALTAESFNRIDLLESDLLDILQLDPDNANALNALGYTLADHGVRIDEAQKYVERAYELKPNDPAIIDSMGWVHFRLGNYAEAETFLRKALDMLDDAEIIGHLGEILWAQGNEDEARELLLEALDRFPEDDYIQDLIKQYSE
jgi:tetratricopeptide (TPR) repeat protein